ncbi:MAG TPA: DNA-binding protein [Chloroflexi bacterium]|nr:DNA-binding protein [Chloroflexota bacterium]
MEVTGNEIMTAQEVAQYLRLAEATVYKLAQAGEIPAVKVGRAWRFKKALIDEWFRREAMQNSHPDEVTPEATRT